MDELGLWKDYRPKFEGQVCSREFEAQSCSFCKPYLQSTALRVVTKEVVDAAREALVIGVS
jgi:hypothetical protein